MLTRIETGGCKPWSDDDKETVRALWQAGSAASQIAREFSGRTRNAVIGLVNRNGWSGGNPKPDTRYKKKALRRRGGGSLGLKIANGTFGKHWTPPAVERPEPRPIKDIPKPVSRAIPLLELTDKTCRYPDGGRNESAVTFCGCPVFGMNVYCEYHCRVAYQPPERRRARNLERIAGRV